MEWQDLLRALGLVLVFEGLMPFAAPARWRAALATVAQANDRLLRVLGLASMLAGVILLQLI